MSTDGPAVSASKTMSLLRKEQWLEMGTHLARRRGAHLHPGAQQGLTLHREPDNRHDPQAVAVYRGAHKLGVAPRAESAAVASLLDQGVSLQARIVHLGRSRNPWERVRIEIQLAAPPAA